MSKQEANAKEKVNKYGIPEHINPNPDYYRFIAYNYDRWGSQRLAEYMDAAFSSLPSQLLKNASRSCECPPSLRIKFLDVGCGVTNILNFTAGYMIAKNPKLRIEFTGIEYNKAITDQLADNVQGHRIINIDALQYAKYGDFDIIYYYRPISHPPLMSRLAKQIADQAKIGAAIIGIGWPHDVPLDRFRAINGKPVYIKENP